MLDPFKKTINIQFDKIDKILIRLDRTHTVIKIYAGEIKTDDWALLTIWEYKKFAYAISNCGLNVDIYPLIEEEW